MSEVPIELGFASTHEWAKQDEEGLIVVGISDHAQDALGDIVYVEMPEVGQQILAGEEAGVVESVKAASDIYSPVSGTVEEVNERLDDSPETVNHLFPEQALLSLESLTLQPLHLVLEFGPQVSL